MTAPRSQRTARLAGVLEDLRRDIVHGVYPAHEPLPGERDLAARLAVSRTALRRMLAALVAEGLLFNRQGIGTFVKSRDRAAGRPAEAPPPAGPADFTQAVAALGFDAATSAVIWTSGRCSAEEAMGLGCAPEAPVLRLERLCHIGAAIVAWERVSLPAWALPGPSDEPSLQGALAAAGHGPERAIQRIRFGRDEAAADRLGLPAGTTVVILNRIDIMPDGRRCALGRTAVRPDCFDLAVSLTAGSPLGFAPPGTATFA